jgi:NADH:ubiquinone oxidoreductase subunit B-like Fe-S oxidoreductase
MAMLNNQRVNEIHSLRLAGHSDIMLYHLVQPLIFFWITRVVLWRNTFCVGSSNIDGVTPTMSTFDHVSFFGMPKKDPNIL